MIHRINSVAPDLDDRVIKPNQARDAKNLRFGASTDDGNLSGGVMVNGTQYITTTLYTSGTSQVIGELADLENQVVYFCRYNSDGAHGVYRIKTVNGVDVVEAILGNTVAQGSWLNFQFDSSVSMTSIDGKLYFTDNINQPRMVNIEKGILTQKPPQAGSFFYTYPALPQEWHYTQIKRAPQEVLEFVINSPTSSGLGPQVSRNPPVAELIKASADYDNIFEKEYGWQFSYYYVYDNNEESRIAPISSVTWFNIRLTFNIPQRELLGYIKDITLIKKIVFIYREKNDGEWSVFKTINNLIEDVNGNLSLNQNFTFTIPNLNFIANSPVSSNITSNFFDAVPRLSATNEIAQNIINHGNYLIDYPNWGGLNLEVTPVKNNLLTTGQTFTIQDPVANYIGFNNYLEGDYRAFYRGNYNVGIELLDEWGRRISVVNQQVVEIPNFIYQATQLSATTGSPFVRAVDDSAFNCYKLEYKVTGSFPSWCKYWRVVYSKNQSVNYFNKTVCKIYYWYSDGTVDYLSVRAVGPYSETGLNYITNQPVASFTFNKKTYTLKGIAVELSNGEPFLFTNDEEQYIAIAREYYAGSPSTTNQKPALKDFKIKKQVNNFLFIDSIPFQDLNLYPGWERKTVALTQENQYTPLYYQIYFFSKKTSPSPFYYQSTSVKMVGSSTTNGDPLNGYLYGDCYLNKFKKRDQGGSQQVLNIGQNANVIQIDSEEMVVTTASRDLEGDGISMNIRNIYSQEWISDIGQLNIVNEDQQEVRIPNGICFSNPLIVGTQINGLSKFDPLDIRQAPLENGPITGLATTNATQREPGVMLAIGTYGVQSFYYNSVQLTNTDGTTNIATSDAYLGSQRPLQGQFGCSQLKSITKTPLAAVYWWSDVVNDFIRYSNAGLERLGLTYLFGNKLRSEVAGKKVSTVYDYITDEVILMPRGGNSFVFSERYKTFQGMREYIDANGKTPDMGVSISQRMYHFIDGLPTVTTAQTPKNEFFNLSRQPQLTIVTNEAPSTVKQWNQIKVYGPKPIGVEMVTGDAEGFDERKSFIDPRWWIQRKGEYDAAIRRDVNSGNGTGMSGKLMESRILYSTFVFNPASFEKLNFIEVKSNMSLVQ